MNVASIIAEFGAYYLNEGQNASRLVRQLRDKSVTDELFSTRVTDETIYRASEVRIDRLLQPFQKSWTPIGTPEFVPVQIQSYAMKMDFEMTPDDLEASWLGFLADNNLDRKQWPIVRYLVEQELLPGIKRDYENNEVYKGVYAAPAAGSAGAAGTAMQGIKKIINNHITAGRITPITMGAFPATVSGDKSVEYQICEYFEDFVAKVNDKYWGVPMEIATSPQRARQFKIGYGQKYGSQVDYTKNTDGAVDFSMFKVVGKPSHRGSDKIWTTPKDNAVRILRKSANYDKVQIENVDRKVKIYTDFWGGIGYLIPETVFTNDLELNPPAV